MTAQSSLTSSLSDIDKSRTCCLTAEKAHSELAKVVDWLESKPDDPGLKIHILFARLYLHDTEHWLKKLKSEEGSEFLLFFVARFIDAYFKQVTDVVQGHDGANPGNWVRYFDRSEKLTLRSNIFSHLFIVITALNTHICRDIPDALLHSSRDFEDLFGRPLDLTKSRSLYFDPINRDVLFRALLEFIAFHRAHTSTFRRRTLDFFVSLLKTTPGIWWPVLSGWRRKSWEVFEKQAQP